MKSVYLPRVICLQLDGRGPRWERLQASKLEDLTSFLVVRKPVYTVLYKVFYLPTDAQ